MNTQTHPRALYLLFVTEMWERFSYYGMRALLMVYLVTDAVRGGAGWTAKDAGQLYGIYTGLVYITPFFGGILADRWLGQQRSVLLGALLMALGHGSLALGSDLSFYLGLVLLILGNGFFKPNISTMVGRLYSTDSPLKDAGYTIFYMGINIGAFLGTLICGYLGENIGWHIGFGAAGVFMTLSLIFFYFGRTSLGQVGIHQPTSTSEVIASPLQAIDIDRIKVIFVFSLFSILFWMAFEQAGSSMSIFALNYTDRRLGIIDFEVPASWFQSLNPLFVITLAPVVAWFWCKSSPRIFTAPIKFSMALGFQTLSFLILAVGSMSIVQGSEAVKAGMWLLSLSIFFQTVGELCISPVGLSLVSKLAATRYTSMLFGVWFLASAIGNYISGAIGGLIEEVASEYSMSAFFAGTASVNFLAGICLLMVSPKLIRWMHGIS